MAGLVSIALLIDIAINTAWVIDAGMKAVLVVPDPHRIAYSYYECDYSTAEPYIWAHIAVKGLMIAAAVVLAWSLRKVSSQFNESAYIGLCSYTLVIMAALIIPLISSNVGGHSTVFLIRAYALQFLSAATATFLMLPKALSIYASGPTHRKDGPQQLAASLANPPTDPPKQWASDQAAHAQAGTYGKPTMIQMQTYQPKEADILPNAMYSIQSSLMTSHYPHIQAQQQAPLGHPPPSAIPLPVTFPSIARRDPLRDAVDALENSDTLDENLIRLLHATLTRRTNRPRQLNITTSAPSPTIITTTPTIAQGRPSSHDCNEFHRIPSHTEHEVPSSPTNGSMDSNSNSSTSLLRSTSSTTETKPSTDPNSITANMQCQSPSNEGDSGDAGISIRYLYRPDSLPPMNRDHDHFFEDEDTVVSFHPES